MPTDFYEVLGVGREATDDEIKRAYRSLARQYHPDANDGDPAAEARFKEISLAYDTLRDPEKRRRYDMYGAEGMGAGAGPNMGGFDFGVSDLFDAFFGAGFGGGRGPGGPARGPDAEVHLILDLEEAVFGATKPVELRMPVECERCSGLGCEPGTHPSTCRTCGGVGEVRTVRRTILGQMMTATPCTACRGTGREALVIPTGTQTGRVFKLRGRGVPSLRGRGRGDLIVSVEVVVPEKLSAEEAQLIRRLAELRGEDVAPREEGFFSRIKSAFQ